MKKIFRTICIEIFISILIFFTIVFFISYMNLDDYITNNYLSLVLKNYDIKIDKNNINLKFPLTLEFKNVNVGSKSSIKESSIVVSPLTFFNKNKVNILDLKLEKAIIYRKDLLDLLNSQNPSSSSLNYKINNIDLRNFYLIHDSDVYIKFKNSDMFLEKDFNNTLLEIRESIISYRENTFNVSDSSIEKKGGNIDININSAINESNFKLTGSILNDEININVILRKFNLNKISSNSEGIVSISGQIFGNNLSPKFSGTMSLKNGSYKNVLINDGKYDVFLSKELLKVNNLNVVWKNGILEGNLSYLFSEKNRLKGNFKFQNINISELLKDTEYSSSLNGKVNFSGVGTKWRNFVGDISLKDLKGTLNNERIKNGNARLHKDHSSYKVQNVELDVGDGSVKFNGNYYNGSYNYNLNLKKVKIGNLILENELNGIIDFEGNVKKNKNRLFFDGNINADNLSYKNSIKIDNIEAKIEYKDLLNLDLNFNKLNYKKTNIFDNGKIKLSYSPKSEKIKTEGTELYITDKNKINLNFIANKAKNKWKVENFSDSLSIYNTEYEMSIDKLLFNKKSLNLEKFKIENGDSYIVFNANTYYDLLKTNLSVESNLDLSILKKYFKAFNELQGQANFNFDYQSIGKDNNVSKFNLTIPKLTINTSQLENVHYNNIELNGSMKDNNYQIINSSFYVDEVKNSIAGDINLNITKKSINIKKCNIKILFNKMYSSYLVNPFIGDVAVIDGYFKGPFKIDYENSLNVNADVEVFDTNLIVYSFGNLYVNEINGDASITDNYLKVDEFVGKTENNKLVKFYGYHSNVLKMSDYKWTVDINKAYMPSLWYFSGWLDGKIYLEGNENRSSIKGNLNIDEGVVDANFKELIGTGQGGTYDFNKALNVSFNSDNDLWVKNENANIEFESDLSYKNEYGSNKLYFTGTLEAIKGNIRYLTVQFDIKKCIVSFPNSPDEIPKIELLAQTYVFHNGKKLINLSLNGDINSPNVELTSDDPSLSQNDIVSLLLFNYTSEELVQRNLFDRKAGEIATHLLQKGILKPIKAKSTLDILNVRGNLLSEEERYLDIEVGKYINEDFYILYRDEYMKTERRTLNFIFYLNDNLSLESGAIEEEGDLKYNIDLRFRFKY